MAVDDPLIGKKLGDYTIQSLLGRGGMSRVYRGYDENLQRFAAVKVISGDFATTTEEEYTRRFTSEARAIAHLRHLNIVGVYQFGRTEGIYYMAQVFLEGDDLRNLLKEHAEKNKRLPVKDVLRIARDVASALDYAHEQGVIHRDIKPSNIMLEKNSGRAILMDFGLALSIHEGTMGDTFGSAHYIAPEQAISSAKAVPQSDQYSLGIVLYEMLAGKVPFDDPSIMSVALKHLNEVPPPPTMYNPDLPPAVETAIMRALNKDPERRHASVTALVDALETAFNSANGAQGFAPAPAEPVVLDSRPTLPDKQPIGYTGAIAEPPAAEKASVGRELANRFAERQAKKEHIAEQNRPLDENELQLDNSSLDSLLDSMDKPLDPERANSDSALRVSESLFATNDAAAPSSVKQTTKKRGSRRSGILVILLVLALGAAGLWFGLGLGNNDDNPDTTPDNAPAIAAADQTATSEFADETPTARATATRPTATRAGLIPQPGDTTESAEVSPTATRRPTNTARPSATNTDEPSATPTAVEPTNTSAPTDTEEPAVTPTEPAATRVAANPGENATSSEPTVRVYYDDSSFLLVNISGERMDITDLIFEREDEDGVYSFRTETWDRPDITVKPNRMVTSGCYQLITASANQVTPTQTTCPFFLGFFRSNVARRYFWIADEPEATFTVRHIDSDAVLATCSIAAGECEFNAESPTSGEAVAQASESTPPVNPIPAPEPVGQSGDPEIKLVYDGRTFILSNISDSPQNVSRLHFELELENGIVRSFLSAEWDDHGIVGRTATLRAGGCLELVTSEADVVTPDPSYCQSFLGWFRSNVSERYFWVSPLPNQTFAVRIANSDTLLAICEVDAGECEFNFPE